MTTDVHTPAWYLALPPAVSPGERLSRGGGWWTLALTLVMLGSMTEALNTAAWSGGLATVRAAALGGALLGFLLALTRWGGAFTTFYSFLASIFWVVTVMGRTIFPGLSLHEAVQELALRNLVWIVALFSGRPSADNLIFVTQLCVLGWWIGHFAIWSLIRHQKVLHAVLPAGAGLLVNVYYAPVNLTSYVIAYLAAVLMLAMRIELARNEARWQLARIRYAPDIYLDFLRAGVIFAILVITIAWTMPGIANRATLERLLRPLEEPWRRVEDTWSRMYSALNYPATAPSTTSFSKSTILGGPVKLTDRPIFEAETPRRTYWRAAIFDTYTGQGWLNTDQEIVIVDRGEPLGEPPFYMVREITATIRVLEERQDVIFAPPQPLRVSLALNADVSRVPRGFSEEDEGSVVVSLMRSRSVLSRNSSYQVVAAITLATPEQLREASAVYPPWIIRRYMQLPEDVPERVIELAQEITASYDNVYDKASAVEARLREYEYNQEILAPPPGQDGVDYFLFDVQQGYCNYYASAMAVMLRAVGIPARFVVGYSAGEQLPGQGGATSGARVYQVQERHAHAWVEVYFPIYGWIQFEPTASEPTLVRPAPAALEPREPAERRAADDRLDELDDLRPERDGFWPWDEMAEPTGLAAWGQTLSGWVIAGLVAVVLAAAAGIVVQQRRRTLHQDPELIGRLFALLEHWAGRLRVPWPASHTPLEHAATFNQAVPEAEPTVNRLAALFVAQQYGRQQPTPEALVSTAQDWQGLQPVLWKGWLQRVFRREE